MIKKTFYCLFALFIISCSQQTPEEQIKNLPGYWEIESVQFPSGNEKEYKISTTIDYIKVEGNKGIRKKVNPQLDGTFKTNKSVENFTLKIENDSLRLYYKTQFNTWKETVLLAKDSTLQLLNKDGNIYKYKKFSTFNFNN